jgi:hypothetical protein
MWQGLAFDLRVADVSWSGRAAREQEIIVKVKVERIRAGRRLPDVEYIEARPPRRPQANRRELDGVRQPSLQDDEARPRLRLPWQIHRRDE